MITYPDDFINACQTAFPQCRRLEVLLRAGNPKAGYFLRKKLLKKKRKLQALELEIERMYNLYLKYRLIMNTPIGRKI